MARRAHALPVPSRPNVGAAVTVPPVISWRGGRSRNSARQGRHHLHWHQLKILAQAGIWAAPAGDRAGRNAPIRNGTFGARRPTSAVVTGSYERRPMQFGHPQPVAVQVEKLWPGSPNCPFVAQPVARISKQLFRPVPIQFNFRFGPYLPGPCPLTPAAKYPAKQSL